MKARTKPCVAALALALAAALLGTGCVSSGSASADSALPFGSAADPDDATTRIEVEALDTMGFAPDEVTVEQGETVLFVVTNTGKVPHEFTLGDDAEQKRHAEEMAEAGSMPHDHPFSVWLDPGETKELAWEFGVAGEFLYGCHVPGHYEAGMVGNITVE